MAQLNLYDIHSHILPGVDDGAKTRDDAIAIARIAVGEGIVAMIATPHTTDWSTPLTRAGVIDRLDLLRRDLAAEGINLAIHPGHEVYIEPDLAGGCRQGRLSPLAETKYVLVELPMDVFPKFTDQALFDLQLAGYTPIIAHPERYAPILANSDILEGWLDRGMISQVTAASFLAGRHNPARQLLERGLVHVAATDTHSARGRPPVLRPSMAEVERLAGEEMAIYLYHTAPKAILEGQPVPPAPTMAGKPRRKWFAFR